MGNSETKENPAPRPFIPDDTIVHVDFLFPDNPHVGTETIQIKLSTTVHDFKKIAQSVSSVETKDYQVQYDNKFHRDDEHFQEFWSKTCLKEVHLVKESKSGS